MRQCSISYTFLCSYCYLLKPSEQATETRSGWKLLRRTSYSLTFNKVQRVLHRLLLNTADVVAKSDSKAFVRHSQHLWPERRTDELTSRGPIVVINAIVHSRICKLQQVIRHRRSVLCVKIGIDFVKDVEGCWVRGLYGKDQGEAAKTWRNSVSS